VNDSFVVLNVTKRSFRNNDSDQLSSQASMAYWIHLHLNWWRPQLVASIFFSSIQCIYRFTSPPHHEGKKRQRPTNNISTGISNSFGQPLLPLKGGANKHPEHKVSPITSTSTAVCRSRNAIVVCIVEGI
jgi:hypothetical protein